MLPFRIVRIGGTAFRRRATCYSVISQLISINQPLGNQFMIFARDGLNSFPGVPLHQGVDNRVPVPVARYGLDWYSSFKPSRFQFFSIAPVICSSIFRMRCHSRTDKRRMMATMAIFFFFGLRRTSSS